MHQVALIALLSLVTVLPLPAQIRARAREEAAGEKARALAEAKSQVGDIAIELASKIVGEALDEEKHKALIDRYLADLEKI